MKTKTILVLGGYGSAGLPIAELLLRETHVRLILAGRSAAKAEQTANQLNAEIPGDRVTWRHADATDTGSLSEALTGADMLVVCSATIPYAERIARTALSVGVDYLDIYAAQKVIPILQSLEPEIKEARRCFITQAGFHPGLLAPFIRHARSYFTEYKKAFVGMVMNDRRQPSLEAAAEIAEMITANALETFVFRNDEWRPPEADYAKEMDFGADFGVRTCYPLWFEELRRVPEECGLEETGAFVAGFDPFFDKVMLRLALTLNKFKQGQGTRVLAWMLWRLSTYSRPPFGVVFKLEAEGYQDGVARALRMIVQHGDPYMLTAICAVACLLQVLDGTIRKPGLWLMGHIVDPARLLKDMERMGAKTHIWLL